MGWPALDIPNLVQAVGYVRASSAANVGQDKDSERLQRLAIERYAESAGFDVVDWFYDPAVSGADPLETRPGFAALLDRVENNGVRIVLVGDASRFARDLVAQELGVLMLVKRGMRVLTAAGDDMTNTSDPSRIMMRQIAGSFHQYEKARLVAKLRVACERKRAETGKCEGRNSYVEAIAVDACVVTSALVPLASRRNIFISERFGIDNGLSENGAALPLIEAAWPHPAPC